MASTGNYLLDTLSDPLTERILHSARAMDLPIRSSLIAAGEIPRYLYFLTRGAASTVITTPEGGSAEVGMIGVDGLVGAAALLGPASDPAACFVQVSGTGLRVPLRDLREMFEESLEFRQRVLQFVQMQVHSTGQISACNRLHEAEARLARWLLTASDVSRVEPLDLTQEFLSQMLGSQRTTVALVAGSIQRRGFIDYSRGKVRIKDRAGLITVACPCYGVTSKALLALYH